MTSLRPISIALLLVLAPAPVVAAEASPHPPSSPPPLGARASRPPFDRATPDPSVVTHKAGETPALLADGTAEGAAPPSPLALQPLEGLSATRERPLFSPTRRPVPPPPPVVAALLPPPPPPPPPDVALFGIVMDGDEVHAVVRAGPAAKMMRVRIGDDVGGWKVAQIEGRQLVLSLDGRIARFMMFAGDKARSAPSGGSEAPPAGRPSGGQTQPQNQQIQPQPQSQNQQNQSRQSAPTPWVPPAPPPHRPRG